ncbi:mRNA capping enzyme-domain-containing protein [Cercophora newfieldiana]|uniref:mRNA cap guanine-N(7) methyltransferase n=1 Tax=Cercophora newfieldiana TaxID=92897 RepID=A0AA40CJN6_9PEZI|nr:mRNA capping enzyme-domain-containing protein [Cercophora newfieldiana]
MAGYDDRDNSPPRRGKDQEASSSAASSSKPRPRQTDDNENDELPQPFDAKKLAPAKKRVRSPSPNGDAPPRQKRPGRRSRITDASREQARRAAEERERATEQEAPAVDPRRNVINDVVRAHYNAVPERGRDWRKTDSRIKGLRSFNNWVKSCIIQKFSPDEDHTPGALERSTHSNKKLLVLDIGCGKGGDLGKWQQAPQQVELYVGLDPADVSIDQARERYRSMASRGGHGGRGGRGGYGRRPPPRLFDARFHTKDCFGEPIDDIDIVREVGFTKGVIAEHRGFDVVSMMFCMHYAFESKEKACQMLQNVAGALRKGGRFIGCIPSSDVIGSNVEKFNKELQAKLEKKAKAKAEAAEGAAAAAAAENPNKTGSDTAKPEQEDGEVEEEGEIEGEETAQWGNDIYRVRFPGKTPEDGIFRPPYGWKYNFFLHEAVEEVPEYVVPWEAFRALAENYNLELQYHKSFRDVWETEKDDRELGPLSERMGVRERHGGALLVSPEEMEAASFYVAFCFYRV